jgi:hypothetical protein
MTDGSILPVGFVIETVGKLGPGILVVVNEDTALAIVDEAFTLKPYVLDVMRLEGTEIKRDPFGLTV